MIFCFNKLYIINYIIIRMGCTKSAIESTIIYNSIAVRNLTEEKKQKIRNIIENDDLLALAFTMQEIECYPNSEISQATMGWMLIHLCCRWDSEECLEYLLKHYFVENPKGYINFINSQTSQGYTCLHLCCIWKSLKCFRILHNFGGIDFSVKDVKLKNAYQTGKQYKCPQIANILKQYKDLNVVFKQVQVENLLKDPLINIRETTFVLNEAKQFSVQVDKSLHVRYAFLLFIPENEKKIWNKRSQIQKALQKLLEEKVLKSLWNDTKRSNLTQNLPTSQISEVQKQEYIKVEKQKLNQQLKSEERSLEAQISQKQQQLKEINQQIKKIQEQKIENIKFQYQKMIEGRLQQLQKILNEKIKQKQQFLARNKTNRTSMKSRETKTFKQMDNQQERKEKLKKCPPEIIKLYEKAKEKGYFEDEEFPANNKSIGDDSKLKYWQFTTDTVWLRPRQMFRSDFQLFDGIDPDDIKQGSLGVCYMLATLSALAAHPKNILNIFIFSDIEVGFYVLRLYVNGIPKYLVVDDLIPCSKITKSPLFTQPIGKQVWVLLLEKAWAKVIGNYLSAQSMSADHIMQDLSGAPGYGWWLTNQNTKTPTQKIKQIVRHNQLGHVIVITSSNDTKMQGIVANHAYSMLKVYNYGNRFIFKIRNPWGNFDWNGQFSLNSSLCTEQFKKKVSYNRDYGIFYISENQLLKAFCYYSINHIKNDYDYSYVSFQSKKHQDLFYKFTLENDGEVNIRVTQPFNRIQHDKNYNYSPMIFEVGKIQANNEVTFISQGHQKTYFGAKSVHAFQDIFSHLEAGTYFIRVRMLWINDQKYNTAVLGCYSANSVTIEKLDSSVGLNYLKSLFISFAKNTNRTRASNGYFKICTMKGQFVFIAQTEQEGQFQVNFKLNKQKMIKAQTDIGKVNDTMLSVKVNKQKCGVATLMRTQPAQGGTTGSVNITFQKETTQ